MGGRLITAFPQRRKAAHKLARPVSYTGNAGESDQNSFLIVRWPSYRLILLWGVFLVDPLLKWDRDNAPAVFADIERAGLFVQRHRSRRCETIGDHGRRTGWIIEAQD